MSVEKPTRPSRLRLEAFRDAETGHILLNSGEAKSVLLESLLADYRRRVSKLPRPYNQPHTNVEVLARIASSGEEGKVDYTEERKKFLEEIEKASSGFERLEREPGVMTPHEDYDDFEIF